MDDIVKSQPEKKQKFYWGEVLSPICWLYLITKLFIFDFDNYLINKYIPSLHWLIEFKFFVFLLLVSIAWILLKTNGLLRLIGFTVFYPAILLLWRTPKLLFKSKSWVGVFAFIEIVMSFFKSLKLNFLMFTLVSISCLLILATTSKVSLISSMAALYFYLIIHFIRQFKYAFEPFSVFSIRSEKIVPWWNKIQSRFCVTEIKKYNDKQEVTVEWADNLQHVLILNRICYFLMSKLRIFQKSRFVIIFLLSGLIYTVFITIMVFGFQNLALFKMYPSSFSNPSSGNFTMFLYYSINTLFTNSINDFYPVSSVARFFSCIEIIFGFLILVILVFLLTTISREKHSEQIEHAIISINSQALVIEDFLEKEFKMNVETALQEVEKTKGSMLKIIYFLTSNIT